MADEALALVAELVADDEGLQALAEELLTILEGVIRTSCAAETVKQHLEVLLAGQAQFPKSGDGSELV